MVRFGGGQEHFNPLFAVGSGIDPYPDPAEHHHRNLLIDLVVFDQQHPQSRKIGEGEGFLGIGLAQDPLFCPRQRVEEGRTGDRFGQKAVDRRIVQIDFGLVVGADHQDRGDLGSEFPLRGHGGDRPDRLFAVHPRHQPVHQNEVVAFAGPVGLHNFFDRFGTLDSLVGTAPETLDHLPQDDPGDFLIVDNEDTVGFFVDRRMVLEPRDDFGLKIESKRRPDPFLALDAQLASHRVDEFLRNRQPQPRSAVTAGRGAISLHERHEQPLQFLLVHPDPRIADAEGQARFVIVFLGQRDREGDMTGVGEFEGVAEQVAENLIEPKLIPQDHPRNVAFHVKIELKPARDGTLGKNDPQLREDVFEIEGFVFQFDPLRLDFRIVENVVDDPQQHFRRPADFLEVVLLPQVELGVEQQFAQPDDGVHRGADFMAHIGQESALGNVGLFGPCTGLLDGVAALDLFGDVLYRPPREDRGSESVAFAVPDFADPFDPPVIHQQAVFDRIFFSAFERMMVSAVDAFAVFGMDVVQERLVRGDECRFVDLENMENLGRPFEFSAAQIEFPASDMGNFLGFLEHLFTLLERCFGLFAFGNVNDDREEDFPVTHLERGGMDLDGADLAVFEAVAEDEEIALFTKGPFPFRFEFLVAEGVDVIDTQRLHLVNRVAVKVLGRVVRVDNRPGFRIDQEHRGVVPGEHVAEFLFAAAQFFLGFFEFGDVTGNP